MSLGFFLLSFLTRAHSPQDVQVTPVIGQQRVSNQFCFLNSASLSGTMMWRQPAFRTPPLHQLSENGALDLRHTFLVSHGNLPLSMLSS